MMSDEPALASVSRNDDILPLSAGAAKLHQAGKLDEAAEIYRKVLARAPYDFDANHLLGIIALQQGDLAVAQRMLNAALIIGPNNVAAIGNLGISYLRDGQLEAALQWFQIAVKLEPGNPIALTNAAQSLYHLGRNVPAIALLQKACAVDPSSYAAHQLLGACYMQVGDEHNAAKIFEVATQLQPEAAEAWANLSVASNAIGHHDRARECADRAARLRPDSAAALNALAKAQLEQGRIAEAIENHRRGTSLGAPSVDMLLSYANALLANGLNQDAVQQLKRARALDGNNPTVRWALAIAHLKTVYESESEVKASRDAFGMSLDEIKSWYESTPGIEAPYKAVGTIGPFLLAYQNYNNRDLLQRYGELCVTFMSTLPLRAPVVLARSECLPSGRKLRLGVVSAHIREHSIWTAVTKGWVQHLDRSRFEISVFHLSTTVDKETEAVIESGSHFDNRPMGLAERVEAISSRELDVILYPEIGSDLLAARLAALRLAPVQAVAWGHPETSGLPTIDLFLSAEAFEPASGANNYSERLVTLPNFGVYVEPVELPNVALDLKSLNLPENQPLLLCPGQPFKYAPRYDEVWVRIAKGLRKGRFFRNRAVARLVFFRSQNDTWDRILEKRLRAAFADNGIDFDTHVSIVAFLDHAQFFSLMRRSSLMLDTLGFSGFNTALQGIQCGLPVLAFEGEFLRGRLASGIMRELDLPELVANNPEDFARKAVALAKDRDQLAAVQSKIVARRDKLFRNLAPIRALERCLSDAVAGAAARRQ
jgi:protein O-GlcNAc transferase